MNKQKKSLLFVLRASLTIGNSVSWAIIQILLQREQLRMISLIRDQLILLKLKAFKITQLGQPCIYIKRKTMDV